MRDLIQKYGVLGLIGTLVGIAGFIFGIFSWWQSRQSSDISYFVSQVQILNKLSVDGESEQKFKVLDSEGAEISSNIYGAEVIIWNSGNAPISPDMVRRDLSIGFSNGVKILDFLISGDNNNGISEFSLSRNENFISVKWKYFDPGSAVKVRIIYSSSEKNVFTLSGKIFGISDFNDTSLSEEPNKVGAYIGAIGIVVMITMLLFSFVASIIKAALNKNINELNKPENWMLLTMISVTLGTIYIAYVVEKIGKPPDISENAKPSTSIQRGGIN